MEILEKFQDSKKKSLTTSLLTMFVSHRHPIAIGKGVHKESTAVCALCL